MKALRWGDQDRYCGPFTWSYSAAYPHWSITISSRGDDDGDSWNGGSALHVHLGKATLIVALPGIVRPWREKVYPASWDAATIQRLGRDWYWKVDHRKYGFSYSNGFLSVYYGRTGGACADSSIEQHWGYFLPWTQWRHVRHSLYDLSGEHFWTDPKGDEPTLIGDGWEVYENAKEACPCAAFAFDDFDGQRLTATTRIEEREWHFGTGWFKWLSWFRRPMVKRSLDIEFSGETGRAKGSWKGGTIGTGIEMLPGELHEAAFRRHCDEERRSKHGHYRISFVGRA